MSLHQTTLRRTDFQSYNFLTVNLALVTYHNRSGHIELSPQNVMAANPPLDPLTVSHVIMSLVSENKQLADQTRQRIENLITSYPDGSMERQYLNNLITIIDGGVAKVINVKDSLKQKVEDFNSINEEAALVIGTFLAAVSQIGNIANMAILSGSIAGAIKIGFKIAKWLYKNAKRKELVNRVSDTLQEATKDATQIYNNLYQPEQRITVPPETLIKLSATAVTFSTAVI